MSEERQGFGIAEDVLRQGGGVHALEHGGMFLQEVREAVKVGQWIKTGHHHPSHGSKAYYTI